MKASGESGVSLLKKGEVTSGKNGEPKDSAASLLAEIDALCKELGCSFSAAVDKFRVFKTNCSENDSTEEKQWGERFKKYRQRSGKLGEKALAALSKLRDFLQKEVDKDSFVYPQPLLDLVKDDPVCSKMKSLSKEIRGQVRNEDPED